jgi:hypothetical protein
MTQHRTGTREEWLAARLELLNDVRFWGQSGHRLDLKKRLLMILTAAR